MLVKEQFLYICEQDLSSYLREKEFDKLEELAKRAERYSDAHSGIFARSFWKDIKNKKEGFGVTTGVKGKEVV